MTVLHQDIGKTIQPKINTNLSIQELASTFKTTGRLEIPDFLDTETADHMHYFYNELYPSEWWSSSSVPALYKNGGQSDEVYDEYNQCDRFQNTTVNQSAIKVTYEYAHKANGDGRFAYFFWRSFNDHPGDCICQECQLSRFFISPNFIQFLNAITGNTLNITAPFTIFTSKYSQGCFLNTHSDDMNGRLAFVYHLTKDWRPDFGGLFTAQDKDRNILKTVVPSFNKFVCFKVGDYVAPHSVTQVAHNVQKHRISLTGWYK
jgi:SM-20-related protein